MRIWILSSELPHEIAGGIGRYVMNWARVLDAAGHEVVVIGCAETPYGGGIGSRGKIVTVKPRFTELSEANPGGRFETKPGYPYDVLGYSAALSYQMADEILGLLRTFPPPDVIESQEFGGLPYFLLQRKLTQPTPLETIPILVHLHSPSFELSRLNREPRYHLPSHWVGEMERFCIVAADALLSPSRFLAHSVTRDLRRDLDIAIIPHPFPASDAPVSSEREPRHLVCVGRLQAVKGVLPLVDACHRLWERGEHFRLTMVGGDASYTPGDTTLGTYLRQRYGRWIDGGQLVLTGRVEHDVALQCMRRAAAVVIPSLFENFPNTCLEAMAMGQVVMATQSGGQAEILGNDGSAGFLFDWERPGDFECQLARVLDLGEAERRAIGERARARLRTLCDPTEVLARRVQHYETIVCKGQPRRMFPTRAPTPLDSALPVPEGDTGLLSVVIFADQRGLSVEDTLASVRASSPATLEIAIVVSQDSEVARLRRVEEARGPSTVRVLRVGDPARVPARAVGTAATRGEFVAYVRAGDQVGPEFLERARTVMQRYANVGFVYSWVRYLGHATGIRPTWNVQLPYALVHPMVPRCVVLRRSALRAWESSGAEPDGDFADPGEWLALLEAGWAGVSLPDLHVSQQVSSSSANGRAARDRLLDLYDRMTLRHPAVYREWGLELFNLQNANGPGIRWYHPGAPSLHIDPLRAEDTRWIDYEIGGRLVNRVRRTWLARRLLRHPQLRRLLRRLVRRSASHF